MTRLELATSTLGMWSQISSSTVVPAGLGSLFSGFFRCLCIRLEVERYSRPISVNRLCETNPPAAPITTMSSRMAVVMFRCPISRHGYVEMACIPLMLETVFIGRPATDRVGN